MTHLHGGDLGRRRARDVVERSAILILGALGLIWATGLDGGILGPPPRNPVLSVLASIVLLLIAAWGRKTKS